MDQRYPASPTELRPISSDPSHGGTPRLAEPLADIAADRLDRELGSAWCGSDPKLQAALVTSRQANFHDALRWVRSDDGHPRPPVSEAEQAIQLWARSGLSIGLLLRTYWIEQIVLLEAMMNEIDAGDARAVADTARRLQTWVDKLAAEVSERFEMERTRLSTPSGRRLLLTMDLLRGAPVDSASLGYELTHWHLGCIVWGNDPAAAILDLATKLDRTQLTLMADDTTAWGWIGGAKALSAADTRKLMRFNAPRGTALALGDCLRGVPGFRESHRQALDARDVARLTSSERTLYHDVALEALTTRDLQSAHAFARRELNSLAETHPNARRDRETLSAYLAAGQRASAAAAVLGITDETVANRLRRIEDHLGVRISDRSAELAVALRIWDAVDMTDAWALD
jgi:DNA-binding PucR family transcriptional regulator